ncbi:MAG: OmpA family protein [Rhizobiales bacterium]|nr:OmpA family protein [Hyphomicrobiales bacterium]
MIASRAFRPLARTSRFLISLMLLGMLSALCAEAHAENTLPAPEPALTHILFTAGSADLSAAALTALDSFTNQYGNRSGIFEVRAYGGATENGTDTKPRRIALKRALAIRSHLAAHGISTQRLILRAFGAPSDTGDTNRADILYASR